MSTLPAPSIPLARFRSRSPEETFLLARRLGQLLPARACLGLDGDLGSGKTLFTKGLASGLGVARFDRVNSPTFVIKQEYVGRSRIHHYDTYRLGGIEELDLLGFTENTLQEGIVVLEWAGRVSELLPPETLRITFSAPGRDENEAGHPISALPDLRDLPPATPAECEELALEPPEGSRERHLIFEGLERHWGDLFRNLLAS